MRTTSDEPEAGVFESEEQERFVVFIRPELASSIPSYHRRNFLQKEGGYV